MKSRQYELLVMLDFALTRCQRLPRLTCVDDQLLARECALQPDAHLLERELAFSGVEQQGFGLAGGA